jgi:hypothetical protein
MIRLACCFLLTGFVSRPVRETLALNALEGERSTFAIAVLARVELEVPFREVAMQVRFADRMVRAKYRAAHGSLAKQPDPFL